MYVDESGDVGTQNSPSRYFILSAIIVHESMWGKFLSDLVAFRRGLKTKKGLLIRDEIHSTEFVRGNTKSASIRNIKKHDRLDILKQSVEWLALQNHVRVITVRVDKQGRSDDIFDIAWNALIMRFENTISYGNFPRFGNTNDRGLILPDNTNNKKLTATLRKMRHFNSVPNHRTFFDDGSRNLALKFIVEDPVGRDSRNSLIHQMSDIVAYCARQLYEPNSYMRQKGGRNFYQKLMPVLLLRASPRHPLGIVQL